METQENQLYIPMIPNYLHFVYRNAPLFATITSVSKNYSYR